jgi:hypothetical protein
MVTGILTVALALIWLSYAHRGDGYASSILPATMLWGLGDGLVATPLTAAVLAAINDTDLGAASAINNAASWVGGVVAIAIVPTLIGTSSGTALADTLDHGYQFAMISIAGLSVLAALVTALFATDSRLAGLRLAPHPRTYACAAPVSESFPAS